jgi:hypothetical protein
MSALIVETLRTPACGEEKNSTTPTCILHIINKITHSGWNNICSLVSAQDIQYRFGKDDASREKSCSQSRGPVAACPVLFAGPVLIGAE